MSSLILTGLRPLFSLQKEASTIYIIAEEYHRRRKNDRVLQNFGKRHGL